MKKKKLLLITAISPFPQDSGGATRIRNTIKELSEFFDLYLISFKDKDYQLNANESSDLNKWCQQITFIPTNKHKIKGSYIKFGQPYWFSDWYSPELITAVRSTILNHNIDIIQIEFSQLLYIIDYLQKNDQKKCIFTSHDISTISFYRRLKLIHFFRFIEIYFYEKKYLPKYRQINVVSENDKKNISKYFKIKKIIVVPNGIEKIEFLKNKETDTVRLGYIGSFSHPPNKTAVLYFIDKIAPLLEKNKIKYQYYLAGNNNKITEKKIINLGFVDNLKDFFQKIDILITPISAGSGSRIKILEALGFGKKIVSSKIGAEGIELNTKLISICDTPQDYIDVIKNYRQIPIDYKKEEKNISKLTWKNIFTDYSKSINEN